MEEFEIYLSKLQEKNEKDSLRGITHGVFVETFGCQQNEADSETLLGLAVKAGYIPVSTVDEADLILVNTCAIREHAEKRALSYIGQTKHRKNAKKDILIGVVGCMMAEPHRVDELRRRYPYVDFTLDPASLHELPRAILLREEEKKRQFLRGDIAPRVVEGLPVLRKKSHRAFVSIMYGCNNFCSYCIVPYVRGRERSRKSAEIINEVEGLVRDGCRDITLLGQNVNSYRGDMDFPSLLRRLDAIEGDFILRFMTSHPKDASDELLEVMAESKHIEPHFHLPVQSGSDRILKAMNRHYDRARYLSIVKKLREKMPDIVLTTDIIVGFPGETEEDFEQTLSLLREVSYDMVFSFIYSPREGTPAAKMENAVPEKIQGERFRRMLLLQDDIAEERAKPYVDRTLRVLVDGVSKEKEGIYSGRTDGGKLVHFSAAEKDIGEFRYVKILRADPYALHGEIVKNQ